MWTEADSIVFLRDQGVDWPLAWTRHPVLAVPSQRAQNELIKTKSGLKQLLELHQAREAKIKLEVEDPFRHGVILESWRDADEALKTHSELLISGGNRAGKTEYCARKVNETLVEEGGKVVWCLHTTGASSTQMQQPVVYKYIPQEWKTLKRGRVQCVQYTLKNGFSDNIFIFPQASQCVFMNYAQERRVIEGGEVDLVWCDELVPLDWIETLRYRIITRRGKLVVSFTPVTGYTPVVRSYVAGCRILETRQVDPQLIEPTKPLIDGCPPGHVPYTAETMTGTGAMIWFHSVMNPFNPYDELVKAVKGRLDDEILIRAYGIARKAATSQFPLFSDAHVIDPDKVPAEGTDYMVTDPAGARNWFTIWARVDKLGRIFIWREWPDLRTYGPWAVPADKPDGKAGEAQTLTAGRGIDEYKRLFRTLEAGREPFQRFIDPRAGATQAAGKEGGTSIIDLLATEPDPMYFEPAAGISVEQGVAQINDLLFYKKDQPLVALINEPRLYISADCANLIYCIREWTGLDGEKGATKDPVDCLRYLVVQDPEYLDPKREVAIGGGSY